MYQNMYMIYLIKYLIKEGTYKTLLDIFSNVNCRHFKFVGLANSKTELG